MKFTMGNNSYITYDISQCNLQGLLKTVYPIKTQIEVCPICGDRLYESYSYAVQINKKECVKLYGKACFHCDACFIQQSPLTDWFKIKKFNRGTPIIDDSFALSCNSSLDRIFDDYDSVFRQYILLTPNKCRVVLVTCKTEDESEEQSILHYTHPIANQLLKCERGRKRKIIIDEIEYTIAFIKHKDIIDDDIKSDIDESVENQININDMFPDYSTATTLYVYKGHIACHKYHHTTEVKVVIPCLGKTYGFFAEYCYECRKYIMKYADYESYLKQFRLFPSKVQMQPQNGRNDFYNRAEKSPLMLSGYSVNSETGLSPKEREHILSFIIDHGILTKRQVLDYLEMFIQTNQNNPTFDNAVFKWKEDKEFVLDYSDLNLAHVIVGKVARYRK